MKCIDEPKKLAIYDIWVRYIMLIKYIGYNVSYDDQMVGNCCALQYLIRAHTDLSDRIALTGEATRNYFNNMLHRIFYGANCDINYNSPQFCRQELGEHMNEFDKIITMVNYEPPKETLLFSSLDFIEKRKAL